MNLAILAILLQERFFWPRMNDDIRTHIHSCERCLRFKQKPERDKMNSFQTSYPLEIVHMDFLTIGSKKDPNKDINVLVIMDHFTHYMQAFVTSSQTAVVGCFDFVPGVFCTLRLAG